MKDTTPKHPTVKNILNYVKAEMAKQEALMRSKRAKRGWVTRRMNSKERKRLRKTG